MTENLNRKTKFIFITGGVVSSLGKGLASASLAAVLQARGFKVRLRKLDPYLNVDPGTMNPCQHGEVFVTDDGTEADLDLGHYERFSGIPATRHDSVTSGKIYQRVLDRERRGDYLGATIQVIPHVTNEIKSFILSDLTDEDFVLCEIGGTVGDIEGQPYLETIRQLAYELGRERTMFVHLTLLPYIPTAGELKTKPTQHSVKQLQEYGIQPDILLCRSQVEIPQNEKRKIAQFCNVREERVIAALDARSIYHVPTAYSREGLDAEVCKYFGLDAPAADLDKWRQITEVMENPEGEVRIAVVGKYQLLEAYKPTAQKEYAEVQALAREEQGADFTLMPWNWGYYSQKLKDRKFNLNDEMLRPYFELENVKKGVFGLATRLYGITFQKNPDIPVYHKDVEAFDVFDKDGSFLAVLYTDFHPREGKRSGAWMTSYKEQWIDEKTGENSRPHISLVMNFTKPTQDKPALLTFGEVETFLHEFGHSLHGMFANTTYASLSGTNVYWDFVELPSQFMENFAVEKEFLHTFARHYQTGELIPDELVQRIVDSRNFNAAYACLRQVSFGLLDMAWYTRTTPFEGDVMAYEKQAWARAQILPSVEGTCMSTQFSHIFAGGYSAGYYSYKWAEVLDADAFSLFKKQGIFDQKTAFSFRENILSRGGTEHPMTLYKRFRGQEPTIDALLIRNGIKK